MLATPPAENSQTPLFTQTDQHSGPLPQLIEASKALLPFLIKGKTIDHKCLRSAMEQVFGGSDAEGLWTWKDAYDATEGALVLFLHKYGRVIAAQKPAQALVMLEKLQALTMTHARRTEESENLQQFSTPLTLGFLAHHAAQVRADDTILEPSAGTGLLAVYGAVSGCRLILNEYSKRRAVLLSGLFAGQTVTRHNAEQIDDYLDSALLPDVILMNPPFSASPNIKGNKRHVTAWHISAALARLKQGGRMVAITGSGFAATTPRWRDPFKRLQTRCRVIFSAAIDGNVFAEHGTTTETRLTVFDKIPADDPADVSAYHGTAQSAAELLDLLDRHLPDRKSADKAVAVKPGPVSPQTAQLPLKVLPAVSDTAKPARANRRAVQKPALTTASVDLFTKPADLTYQTCDWIPRATTLEEVLYEGYEPQAIIIPCAKLHPAQLVQSAAMASISGPKPSYIPKLPINIVTDGILSDAQLESVIYAGEAHSGLLGSHFKVDESFETIEATTAEDEEAVQFRRGWFLGDGTGCGKGRQVAGVILDNWLKGRKRAIWVSKSSTLETDSNRDMSALCGDKIKITSLSKFKQGADITLDEGILFVTYGTLRTGARQGQTIIHDDGTESHETKKSRVDQIADWLGPDFDGVIIFDEAHAMANAGGSKGSRGDTKPSQQGLAGLRLQYALPNARVVYVSATGATEVSGLAYATRLGLWGTGDFPFITRTEFIAEMEAGGVAAMEMISRDLKALGLYTARSLSYAGIKYEPLSHNLTPEQIRIYDSFADAFKVIHHNIEAALEAVNITSSNATLNPHAKGAARSAFESTKQRFFNHLLTAMKCPSLIKSIEADIERGDAVIIQIVSTCEALLERRLAEIPASEWNDINVDVTPRDGVMMYLMHSFPVQLHEVYSDEDGDMRSRPAFDEQGNPVISRTALAQRDALLEKLGSLPALPGALDQLIQHFGIEMVAEVTGRSKRLIQKDGCIRVQKRPGSSNLDETRSFMEDDKRILIFSDAGGTGRSYHADLGAKNQRLRIHYLLEPGWKADTAIQGLGRSNRTNQAQPPLFRPVSTDVKGERRFLSTIARRLDSLGAITRGQRQTGGQGMFRPEDNLESSYARAALRQLYHAIYKGQIESCSLSTFEDHTGLSLMDQDGFLREELPPITRFLNRMLALKIQLQNDLFDAFETRLMRQVEGAKAAGVYDVGVETLIADSFIIEKRTVIFTHDVSGAETECLKVIRKDRSRPLLLDAALNRTAESNEGRLHINTQSKRAALVSPTTSIVQENGDIEKRVRLMRPMMNSPMTVDDFEKSHWAEASPDQFKLYWQAEVDRVPEFQTSEFHIVTGLLLPIWKSLPSGNITVNRFQSDEGERLIGRLIASEKLGPLYQALGLTGGVELKPYEVWTAVMDRASSFTLTNIWRLKRSLCMGENRFEIIGPCDIDLPRLKVLGCMIEIINWKARVFIPKSGNAIQILTALLDTTPLVEAA